MRFDTHGTSEFRRLHASQAVQLVSFWLRSLFAAGTEAGAALRCLIMQLSAQRASFHTVCRRAVEFPSHSLLRKWWLQWRHSHSLAEWEALLDAALRAPWERLLRGERVWIILDWHSVPYWGRVPPALAPLVRRGPAQSGTTHFFVYASAAVLWHGMRIQVAFTGVGAAESQEAVTTRLLERVEGLG